MLAVTYISATGDTIGTYNPERVYNAGGRPSLKLLQASRANHRPGLPTWDQEMHQVYRVSSSPDVEPSSVGLSISLGELSAGRTFTRDLGGRDVTYLRLFGLDEESPVDVLDTGGLYQWSGEFLQEQPVVPGVFIFFPTLRPFQTPPSVPVLGLTAAETEQILGSDGNPTIYEAEDPFLRESGGLYRLTIPFELRSRGVISSFSLGALGIRDGSERVFLGDRLLVRDIDYTIDNAIGQVTLTQPEALFATASEPVVRVSWEQKAIFQVTPTSVFGFNGRVQAGRFGEFNLLALRQSEQALVNSATVGNRSCRHHADWAQYGFRLSGTRPRPVSRRDSGAAGGAAFQDCPAGGGRPLPPQPEHSCRCVSGRFRCSQRTESLSRHPRLVSGKRPGLPGRS